MPIAIAIKEAAVIIGKAALHAGVLALAAVLVEQGPKRLEEVIVVRGKKGRKKSKS